MEEAKKTDSEPCCTVKVVKGQGGMDCCASGEGERVILVNCDAAGLKGKTIKVVCCPEEEKASD